MFTLGGLGICGLLWAGCSAAHYRKSADREAYGIIQEKQQAVFGQTNTFSIETPYSQRDPQQIPAQEIIEQRQQPSRLRLTIEQAVELAVQNSREYQTEKERVYLAALNLSNARYNYRPHPFANGSVDFTRQANGERVVSGGGRVGVTELLKSGGSLGLTLANDFLRYYTGDPRRSVISSLSVNILQPLLRGAGSRIAAEQLTQAERDVVYAVRRFSQFQREFVAGIVIDYFQLLQNQDQLQNAYEDYQRRLETIRYTEARGMAGRQSQLEVDEARSEELSAKNSYILAATTYRNNLDRFKITLGVPLTTQIELDNSALEKLRKVGLQALDLDHTKAFQIAVGHHPDLLNEIDRFEDSKRKVYVAADQLRTELNLVGGASLSSEPPTDYTNFDPDKVQANIGLELNLPIDRLRERNNYRATLISFESSLRSLSLTLDQKKDQIERGLRTLETLRRSYVIQTNAVAIARRRVVGEQLSLQAGRRTVRNVRDAQDVLIRAENQLTSVLVDYLSTRLQLLLDIGVLDTHSPEFWLRADAVTVPLEEIRGPAPATPEPEQLQTPEQVFKS